VDVQNLVTIVLAEAASSTFFHPREALVIFGMSEIGHLYDPIDGRAFQRPTQRKVDFTVPLKKESAVPKATSPFSLMVVFDFRWFLGREGAPNERLIVERPDTHGFVGRLNKVL
jgi:hypothetical protein